jgi:hypothetical protein
MISRPFNDTNSPCCRCGIRFAVPYRVALEQLAIELTFCPACYGRGALVELQQAVSAWYENAGPKARCAGRTDTRQVSLPELDLTLTLCPEDQMMLTQVIMMWATGRGVEPQSGEPNPR